jgi:Eukaryotic aspartyl protease
MALAKVIAFVATLAIVISLASAKVHTLPLTRRAADVHKAFSLHSRRAWSPPQPVVSANDLASINADLPEQALWGDLVTLGEYYLELNIGGQIVNVLIDTGSSTLAVPLKECINCRPHDRRFDISTATAASHKSKSAPAARLISCHSADCRANSCHAYSQCDTCSSKTRACCSTVAPDKCGFFLQYADGSGAAGALVQADVTLAGLTVTARLGAILRVTEGFESGPVDGIIGFAFPSLACNPTCVTPVFDALVKSGQIDRDVFSICTGKHGGALTLGGSNPSMFKGDLKYVPLSSRKESHFYDVDITGVRVGNMLAEIPAFTDGIVDSGTTILVIAPAAYVGFKRHFQRNYCNVPGLCPRKIHPRNEKTASDAERAAVDIIRVSPKHAASVWKQHKMTSAYMKADASDNEEDEDAIAGPNETWFAPGYCASITDTDVSNLPDISILLKNGVVLTITPEDYMLKYTSPSHYAWSTPIVYRCLGITALPGLEQMENNAIIGDVVLQKYYVEYDRDAMRVGFAPSHNCVHEKQTSEAWAPAPRWFHALSPMFLGSLALASVVAWILIVMLCMRESIDINREEYVEIQA